MNMETRARLLGGHLQILNQPGRGTRLMIDIPEG
jgi:signal transduction histidine kinase